MFREYNHILSIYNIYSLNLDNITTFTEFSLDNITTFTQFRQYNHIHSV